MPGYRGHILGALLLGGAGLFVLVWFGLLSGDLEMLASLGVLIVLGALFPDIDTDSRGRSLFFILLAAFDLALIISGFYIWAAILGLLAMLPAMGIHGGWTHTWWAMLVVPLPILVIPYIIYSADLSRLFMLYAAMVFGYFTHLVLDRRF